MSTLNPVFPLLAATSSVGFSIFRIADGKTYDFAATGGTPQQFISGTPTTKIRALAADANNAQAWVGQYTTTNNAQFTDGWYVYYCWDTTSTPVLLAWTVNELKSGNDLFGSVGSDPLSTAVPGSYASGTAGFALGTFLNAAVGSVPTTVWAASTRTLTAGGGSSGDPILSGTVGANSLAGRIVVGGYEAGQVFKGQKLRYKSESRLIVDQAVQGNDYVIILGTGTLLNGPFSSNPVEGDEITIV